MINILKDKNFVRFLLKFLIIFAACYFGTILLIGLAAPGGYYSPFVDNYLDYVSGIKNFLIESSRALLSLFGIDTYRAPEFIVRIKNGSGVRIAYDCVGYGVMSFWIAFVLSSAAEFKRKVTWLIPGLLLLCFINVVRISLLIVAYNKHWAMPLGIDHHTWFNIVAYLAIFTMIYFFDRRREMPANAGCNAKYTAN